MAKGIKRWVSSSDGLVIIEPHREIRDFQSRRIIHCKCVISGEEKQPAELIKIKFYRGAVPFPPRSMVYQIMLLGVYETSDPKEIELIERTIKENRKRGDKSLREFPFEWEVEVRENPEAEKRTSMLIEE